MASNNKILADSWEAEKPKNLKELFLNASESAEMDWEDDDQKDEGFSWSDFQGYVINAMKYWAFPELSDKDWEEARKYYDDEVNW